MKTLIVAGAGTEIGKTYVTSGLIRAARAQGHAVAALKPVVSGFNNEPDSDPALLLRALGETPSAENLARITPFRYRAPLAPNVAARMEGKAVEYAAVLQTCRDAIAANADLLLIEGAGGIMSPLSDERTFLDLITDLKEPALIVGGSYLGAISHMLTAVEAARARGARIIAGVVSESASNDAGLASTIENLTRLDPRTRYLPLPRGDEGAFGPLASSLLS